MPTDIRAGWAAVMITATIAGCGGEPKQQQGPADRRQAALADVEACSLLQESEIRDATGREAGTGATPDVPEGSPPRCHWAPVQLLVSHASWKTYEEYDEANRRTLEEGYDPANYERLDAPGRYTVVIKGAGMVQAVGERYMVQVAVDPAEGQDTVAAATRLAGLVPAGVGAARAERALKADAAAPLPSAPPAAPGAAAGATLPA